MTYELERCEVHLRRIVDKLDELIAIVKQQQKQEIEWQTLELELPKLEPNLRPPSFEKLKK